MDLMQHYSMISIQLNPAEQNEVRRSAGLSLACRHIPAPARFSGSTPDPTLRNETDDTNNLTQLSDLSIVSSTDLAVQ
jgi:hypothetical protein